MIRILKRLEAGLIVGTLPSRVPQSTCPHHVLQVEQEPDSSDDEQRVVWSLKEGRFVL